MELRFDIIWTVLSKEPALWWLQEKRLILKDLILVLNLYVVTVADHNSPSQLILPRQVAIVTQPAQQSEMSTGLRRSPRI